MAIGNLQQIIPAFFVGPNGERLTPEQIAQRQQAAQSLLGRATDTRPDAGGWASVLTKGLLGYKSGADTRAADAAIARNAEQSQSDIAALLSGGAGYSAPVASGSSPTSAIATGTPVSIPSAPEIRQGLIDRGLQPHIADAFILNFQDESGLNPGINEQNPVVPGSRGGYGLYQLTGPRRREYEAFAAQRGMPVDSADAQLDFLMNELQGSEANAAKTILSAPDTATAAQAIVNNFLRPAPEHRKARAERYGRVATTPQEAIAQVAPQGGDLAMAGGNVNFNDRWNAGSVTPEVTAAAPTPTPSPDVASALMPQQQTGPSESLLAQHDMMLGGALSPSGSSPVAQVLSGYFPDAPGSSPQGGNNQMANIARILGSPYASNEAKQVAMGMYQQQQAQAQAAQEQQRMMAQRQATVGALGINPSLAGADEAGWKAAIDQATRNRNTVTVGNTVYDANTGQPVIQGQGDPTSDIKNYEYAVNNGYGGSFADYQQEVKRAGATNVNVGDGAPGLGKLSSDFGYVLDPATGRPVINPETGLPTAAAIPGSPAAIKAEEEAAAQAAGKRNASDYARTVVQDVGIAEGYIDSLDGISAADGVVGANLRKTKSNIAGTPEYNMRQFVESALSNVTLDTMNRMRETSAAGATGMGNMSDKQLKVIQGVLGQWDPGLPIDDQRLILNRLKNFYMDVQYGSDEERRIAVEEGRMTQDENDSIKQLYSLGSSGGKRGSKTKTGVTWSFD